MDLAKKESTFTEMQEELRVKMEAVEKATEDVQKRCRASLAPDP